MSPLKANRNEPWLTDQPVPFTNIEADVDTLGSRAKFLEGKIKTARSVGAESGKIT